MMRMIRNSVRTTRNPAILWFLQRHGFSSAESGIHSLAQRLIKLYGDQIPPFDLKVIADELKVREISFASIGKDALLIPTEDGFKIKISSELPKSRQRFALAHELGHTLFFNRDGPRPYRPYSKYKDNGAEERLCDIFAGEILIPEYSLRQQIRHFREPTLRNLLNIAKTFDVSVQCLAIRIANLKLWDAAVVNWTPDHAETISIPNLGYSPKLRVNWEATPKGNFVPKIDSAKADSIVYICYLRGGEMENDETMSLGSIRGKHHICCLRTSGPLTKDDYNVLSLINLSSTV